MPCIPTNVLFLLCIQAGSLYLDGESFIIERETVNIQQQPQGFGLKSIFPHNKRRKETNKPNVNQAKFQMVKSKTVENIVTDYVFRGMSYSHELVLYLIDNNKLKYDQSINQSTNQSIHQSSIHTS